MKSLDRVIKETYENASTHTKRIYGKPMRSDQVVALVNAGKPYTSGFLATTNRDGKPHMTWDLVVSWRGKFYTCATRKSALYWNLIRRKGVAAVITDERQRRAVFIEGEGRLIGTAQDPRLTLLSNIEKNVVGFRMPDYERSIFELVPKKIFTYK